MKNGSGSSSPCQRQYSPKLKERAVQTIDRSKPLDGFGLIELLPWSTSNKPVIGGKENGTVSKMCQLPIPVVVACEQEASKDQDV
jgi:hypothetical protein